MRSFFQQPHLGEGAVVPLDEYEPKSQNIFVTSSGVDVIIVVATEHWAEVGQR